MKRFQMVYIFLVLIFSLHRARSGPPPPPPSCSPDNPELEFICCDENESVYQIRQSKYTKCCGEKIYESNSTKQCCGETIFDPTYAKVKCCAGEIISYIDACQSK